MNDDEIDEAVSGACREIRKTLAEMDARLRGYEVEVVITVKRHEGDWAVFAAVDDNGVTFQ